MSASNWKDALQGLMPDKLAHEIDIFQAQFELKRQGKIEDKVFAETRLRRGAYGQRYDNGQRHDGKQTRPLNFPCGDLTKGPDTVWDAPGMVRIKIPYGGMTPDRLEVMADCAEEYSDGILHVTTRQDIQLHFVHIDDTPDMMRRLASVNITTREACGNSIRNITGCPLAGVCKTESFDISPYAKAMMEFLLGHPDVQDFGRKFKPAFSGCDDEACGLVWMHDAGYVAKVNAEGQRGFKVVVGGGLGAVPHQAKVLSEFTPAEELLPQIQAISRVFARLGEKKNRNRARIKFLVAKLGIDEFRRLVEEERKTLPHDDRWTAFLKDIPDHFTKPLKDAVELTISAKDKPEGFDEWASTNLYKQRQDGYYVVTIALPLGDFTSQQARGLADVVRKYVGEDVRTTVEQNLVLRWVSEADLPKIYNELQAIGLAQGGANTILDLVACPGTDTCKLGIAASRGLAGELRTRLLGKYGELPEPIKKLHIKMSGCFNSCGQHHVADIGFYGNSRKIGNHTVPHFQVVLGGQWEHNAGSYGLACGSVPSKAIPAVIDMLTEGYLKNRQDDERFGAYIDRLGKKQVRELLKPFMEVPDYTEDPSYYTDWGDPREFTIGDMGVGECAGEIVSVFSMEASKAESIAFDAQIELEEGSFAKADELAYKAMVKAAQALVRTQFQDITDDPDDIVAQFRSRFYDTELFFDKYAKGKFAEMLFNRHDNPPASPDKDQAHHQIEEAQLFIEACYACDMRLSASPIGGGV
ncbi:nitrite/sulfite reductase [Planctomycetales bacterium ZRK34]|nr:nitrite/sulfite reductase [Planctomycetales bacterium ZRK34]